MERPWKAFVSFGKVISLYLETSLLYIVCEGRRIISQHNSNFSNTINYFK